MTRLRYLKGPVATRSAGGLNNTVRSIRASYETDPAVYAAMLPQPLTPIDRPDFAFNLKLARPFRSLILNMNFHRVHHTYMHLPWWSLPRQFVQTGDRFDGGYARAALAQLRGPAPTDMLIREK